MKMLLVALLLAEASRGVVLGDEPPRLPDPEDPPEPDIDVPEFAPALELEPEWRWLPSPDWVGAPGQSAFCRGDAVRMQNRHTLPNWHQRQSMHYVPTPLDDPCSQCSAQPGEECDRRTRGRHRFHWARVQTHRDRMKARENE